MTAPFLLQEQIELLCTLVDAERSVPRDQRQPFLFVATHSGESMVHSGLPGGSIGVYGGDVQALNAAGFFLRRGGSGESLIFDLAPSAHATWQQQQLARSQPLDRVEATAASYLASQPFRQRFPRAFQKWSDSEKLLWGEEAQDAITTIGHLCREAIQEFAAILVDETGAAADSSVTATKARLKAAVAARRDHVGEKIAALFDALIDYWVAVVDLVQRQEHGAQKEGSVLTWDDGRRVVFHTASIMAELARAFR